MPDPAPLCLAFSVPEALETWFFGGGPGGTFRQRRIVRRHRRYYKLPAMADGVRRRLDFLAAAGGEPSLF